MIGWSTYSDSLLSLRIPAVLRKSPPGQWGVAMRGARVRAFRGLLDEANPASDLFVGIACDLTAMQIEVYHQMAQHPAPMPGFASRRAGASWTRQGGVEMQRVATPLGESVARLDWIITIPIEAERWACVGLVCPADAMTWEKFEAIGTEIIASIQLVHGPRSRKTESGAATPRGTRPKSVGMRVREKSRLANALESLPEELLYLRDPILAIADEDQDMLGSGEVDTTLLAQAIEQQAASQPNGFASAHAEELEEWLRGVARPNAIWAGPVVFVQAFLTGYDMFGGENPQGL